MNEELRMDFSDGKYTVVYYDNGKLVALRFGEVWRDLTGDKMVFWMLHEANQLREQRDELLKALDDAEVALAHFESALHVRVNPPTLSNIQALITKIRGEA